MSIKQSGKAIYATETNGLCKSFKGIAAIPNLNLHVPDGVIYGFIGENGAGKSTADKLICGLLVKTADQSMLYEKTYNPSIRANIGGLIANPACFPGSTVYQNLMM